MIKSNFSDTAIIKILLLTFILASFSPVKAQKSISVKYVDHDEFKIDGVLDEPMWQNTSPSSEFYEWFPADGKLVSPQTELRMMYSEAYLYVSVKTYSIGKEYVTPSYERDFSVSGADVVNLMFDTYSDRANAFLFGMNQFGVQREGIISNGGISGNLDLSWDTKWLGESVIYDKYAIFEIRIPMSAFKFKAGTQQWKFGSMRMDTQSNTNSCWTSVPQNQNQLNLGYYGDMIFEKPLEKTKNPISIIPYITPSYTTDYVNDDSSFDFKTGFDVKVPIKNSFMLDLTVNPDFSSENVVSGENNVTRFEIKRDETRQFFIDNGDLFNGFGLEEDALAFYSRRVGVGEDSLGNTHEVPIRAGVKFTGKVNNNLRIGVLNVQTGGDDAKQMPGNNNLVLAAEQKVFGKSNIGFFVINRQATTSGEAYLGTEYNRVAGSDLNFFSEDNSLDVHAYLHKSFTPDIEGNAISSGTKINLEKRKYTLRLTGQYVDGGYQSDLGYIKRKDIIRANPFAEWKLYPESDVLNTIKFKVSDNIFWLPSDNYRLGDYDLLMGSTFNFVNGSSLGLEYANRYVYLSAPFDPVGGEGGEPLPVGDYYTDDLKLTFNTNKRNGFWMEGNSKYGTFYNGHKFTTEVTFQYRYQPIFFVNLKLQYDDIKLPDPHSSAQLWYVGPTVNFTFTKSLFWKTDIQYSTQTESFFFVSRVQWRYAPLSDIYLTYSDTYDASPLSSLNRGIFLKMTYWLDINHK